jgi:hypothetical protein
LSAESKGSPVPHPRRARRYAAPGAERSGQNQKTLAQGKVPAVASK